MSETKGPLPEPDYLGDGVYVRCDGWQLWLAEGNHTHDVIALEPEVLRKLVAYARRVDEAAGAAHFGV